MCECEVMELGSFGSDLLAGFGEKFGGPRAEEEEEEGGGNRERNMGPSVRVTLWACFLSV